MSRFFQRPILAIETSCDETSAAVLQEGEVLSNVVASQVDMHQKWGGVVPEAAARAHIQALLPTIEEALAVAGLSCDEIGAVAVTNRPGLVGALSVGLSAAKALALRWRIPLLGVHHLEGHLCSVLAVDPDLEGPFLSLIVSGGHTELVLVRKFGQYEILGQTLDDAAGEAFDKAARVLGLGYPGGIAIQNAAVSGDPFRYPLPHAIPDQPFNFSFSGLKTAVLRLVEKEGSNVDIADAAASVQEAIVSVLVGKALDACENLDLDTLTVVGGVSANEALRNRLSHEGGRRGIRVVIPPLSLCTDNAAMIGLAASLRLARDEVSGFDLDALSSEAL